MVVETARHPLLPSRACWALALACSMVAGQSDTGRFSELAAGLDMSTIHMYPEGALPGNGAAIKLSSFTHPHSPVSSFVWVVRHPADMDQHAKLHVELIVKGAESGDASRKHVTHGMQGSWVLRGTRAGSWVLASPGDLAAAEQAAVAQRTAAVDSSWGSHYDTSGAAVAAAAEAAADSQRKADAAAAAAALDGLLSASGLLPADIAGHIDLTLVNQARLYAKRAGGCRLGGSKRCRRG